MGYATAHLPGFLNMFLSSKLCGDPKFGHFLTSSAGGPGDDHFDWTSHYRMFMGISKVLMNILGVHTALMAADIMMS
jgi:hypothetical protein